MIEYMHGIFQHLNHLPFNVWLWLLFALVPLLILRIECTDHTQRHFYTLLLAFGLSYVLMNLGFHTQQSLAWEEYQLCQSQFSDGAIQAHDACGNSKSKLSGGAPAVFLLLFGWIPAVGYVGFWEVLWRYLHKRRTGEVHIHYRGKWLGNLAIVLCVPVLLYLLFLITIGGGVIVHEYRYSFAF